MRRTISESKKLLMRKKRTGSYADCLGEFAVTTACPIWVGMDKIHAAIFKKGMGKLLNQLYVDSQQSFWTTPYQE